MTIMRFFATIGTATTAFVLIIIAAAFAPAEVAPVAAAPAMVVPATPTVPQEAAPETGTTERGMSAGLRLLAANIEPNLQAGSWLCAYYANRDLLGDPTAQRTYSKIAFNWSRRAPLPELPPDGFSVTCESNQLFSTLDNYRFLVSADDGYRLFIDNVPVANEWHIGRKDLAADVPLTPGVHHVRVEYYDAVGPARLAVTWAPTYSAWEARYYATETGPLVLKRNEGEADGPLHFDTGFEAPGAGLPIDGFAAVWEQRVRFGGGLYSFRIDMQGGARVFIDGEPLHDDLDVSGQIEVKHRLTRGEHLIQVFYVERGGHGRFSLAWMPM